MGRQEERLGTLLRLLVLQLGLALLREQAQDLQVGTGVCVGVVCFPLQERKVYL